MTGYVFLRRCAAITLIGGALLLAGCGTTPAEGSTTNTAATATATACARQPTHQRPTSTVGTIQSISGNTLVLAKSDGSTAKVTYSSTTRFTRQENIAPSAIQEGTAVVVRVKKDTNNTYTATAVTLTNGNLFGAQGGSGRNAGANNPCFNFRGGFNRNGGANGSNRNTAGNAQTLTGQVGQVTNTSLTVTDARGNDYVVTLNSSTRITQTSSVTASALQKGMTISVTGMSASDGTIAARLITIGLVGSAGGTPGAGQAGLAQ